MVCGDVSERSSFLPAYPPSPLEILVRFGPHHRRALQMHMFRNPTEDLNTVTLALFGQRKQNMWQVETNIGSFLSASFGCDSICPKSPNTCQILLEDGIKGQTPTMCLKLKYVPYRKIKMLSISNKVRQRPKGKKTSRKIHLQEEVGKIIFR